MKWIIVFLLLGFEVSAPFCSRYNFRITPWGAVQVENQTNKIVRQQYADVWIQNRKVLDDVPVPLMKPHSPWIEFADINGMPWDNWKWKVKGSRKCFDSGLVSHNHGPIRPTPIATRRP